LSAFMWASLELTMPMTAPRESKSAPPELPGWTVDGVKQHGRSNDNHLGRLIGHDCRRLVVHVMAP
jgi:hypothetical protein